MGSGGSDGDERPRSEDELDALEEAEHAAQWRALARGAEVAKAAAGGARPAPRPKTAQQPVPDPAAGAVVRPSSWPVPHELLPTFPRHPRDWAPELSPLGRVLAWWVDCAQELEAGRLSVDLTVRGWALAAGVPASSAVTAVSGKAWPTWRTLGLLCQPVGLRPVLVEDVGRRKPLGQVGARLRGPARREWEAEARATGDPVLVAAAWHNAAVASLRWFARASETPSYAVAAAAGLRLATWSEARPSAPARWVSLPVTFAVADLLGLRLRLMDADRVWPAAPWDR